jgi:hypothetical protein
MNGPMREYRETLKRVDSNGNAAGGFRRVPLYSLSALTMPARSMIAMGEESKGNPSGNSDTTDNERYQTQLPP